MFDKKEFEQRLSIWRAFRETLETSNDPIQDTINFYNKAPLCNLAADPYTQSTWPDPWELLEENNYCNFIKTLAICYTLQLTDCLSQSNFEIHITRDNENSATYYLLYVDDFVVGFAGESYVHKDKLPKTVYSEIEYKMPPLQ
jgi:hypothetical protein